MAGTITRLVYQKRNKQRVNIYIDDVYAFALPDTEAARLKVGQYLSDDEIVSLRALDSEAKAYDKAIRYLGHRPRSQHEIETRLKRGDFTHETRASVLTRLMRLGYVDDRSFVQWWIDNRRQFSPRGQRALRQELRQKGIAAELIEEALQALDEEEQALAAGLTRAPRWSHLPRQAFYKKMLGFLQRRGFGYADARTATDQLWMRFGDAETDETEDW